MFERFTERARHVVVLAQDEARALKHNYVGTEHILLGLLREEEGIAGRVLESLGIQLDGLRVQVSRIIGQGDALTTGQIPFTPRAKKVLELALREARALGHEHIGTEHLLLGVVRENEGIAARLLADRDADAARVRSEVMRVLGEAVPPGYEQAMRRAVRSSQRSFIPATSLSTRVRWTLQTTAPLIFGCGLLFGIGLLVGWLIWG